MGATEIFEALGGGMVGLLGVIIFVLSGYIVRLQNRLLLDKDVVINQQNIRIEKQDLRLEELTRVVDRQSDVIQGWIARPDTAPAVSRRDHFRCDEGL